MLDTLDDLCRGWADYEAALAGDDRPAYAALWDRIEALGDVLEESADEVRTDDLIFAALLSQEAELRELEKESS